MKLSLREHEFRVLSRNASERVDLTDGEGLSSVLTGCDAVVVASSAVSNAIEILVNGSRQLLAAEKAAGIRHHGCVSIVRCERVPMGYFQVKAEQKRVVEGGEKFAVDSKMALTFADTAFAPRGLKLHRSKIIKS
jgi:hypothetical protein